MEVIKSILIGPGGVGKTTLRKIFFDQADPLKLLGEALEPTYGVDTNLYELGQTVAIHDLAGQQIEEWLSESSEVFVGTNLIFCILDAQDTWDKNHALWSRVLEIRDRDCPNAFVGIIIHKIDLIDQTTLLEIREKLNQIKNQNRAVSTATTSINQEFIIETFHSFIKIIREGLKNVGDYQNPEILKKIGILNQFIAKNTTNLADLLKNIDADTEYSRQLLAELQYEGYILVKDRLDLVEISHKGKELIERLRENLVYKIQHEIDDDPKKELIKALIFSDEIGRPFFTYESRPGFFDKLIANEASNSDPTLISMFFSAISDFGRSLDKLGLKLINLSGANIKIVSYRIGSLVVILVLAPSLKINAGVINSMRSFLEGFFTRFEESINIFLSTGNLEKINIKEDQIVSYVIDFNGILQQISRFEFRMVLDDIMEIIRKLSTGQLTEINPDVMKNLIFHYILSDQPELIDKIHKMVNEEIE